MNSPLSDGVSVGNEDFPRSFHCQKSLAKEWPPLPPPVDWRRLRYKAGCGVY